MIDRQQQNEVVLPDGVQKDVFTMVIADNIDRREETQSGKYCWKLIVPWNLHKADTDRHILFIVCFTDVSR